jgi:hypothetical protein
VEEHAVTWTRRGPADDLARCGAVVVRAFPPRTICSTDRVYRASRSML